MVTFATELSSCVGRLAADAEAFDQALVSVAVFGLEIVQEATALVDHLEQAATGMMILVVRAEVLRVSGGGRPPLSSAADIDLQLRMGELCRVWYLPDIEYYYRLHDSSLTHTQRTVEREFFDSLVVELQRQRRTQGSDDLQRGCPLPTPPQGSDKSVMKTAAHTQGLLMGSAWQEHRAGHKLGALAIGMRSVIVQPTSMAAWRSLVALAIKPAGKRLVP